MLNIEYSCSFDSSEHWRSRKNYENTRSDQSSGESRSSAFASRKLKSREMTGQRKVSGTFNIMYNRLVHSVYTLTFSPCSLSNYLWLWQRREGEKELIPSCHLGGISSPLSIERQSILVHEAGTCSRSKESCSKSTFEIGPKESQTNRKSCETKLSLFPLALSFFLNTFSLSHFVCHAPFL